MAVEFLSCPDIIKALLFQSTPNVHAPYDDSPVLATQAKFDAGYLAAPRAAGVPAPAPMWIDNYLAFNGITSIEQPSFSQTLIAQTAVSRGGKTYKPVGSPVQYKGVNKYPSKNANGVNIGGYWSFNLGLVTIFNLDQNNIPVEVWDDSLNSGAGGFRAYTEFLGDSMAMAPIIIAAMLDTASNNAIAMNMVQSGLFKGKSTYIQIGDEPIGGSGVVDFKALIDDADYTTLFNYLTFMPRAILHDFFMKQIYPQLPADAPFVLDKGYPVKSIYGETHIKKPYEDMVWAAFIDVFNAANSAYIATAGLDSWTWEQKKTDAYYSSVDPSSDQLAAALGAADNAVLALDKQATKIMNDFATLPKLGDPGFEINRQNALKQLLLRKEYVTAQAVVDAYRYAKDTSIGDQLTKPIPMNLVGRDGSVIAEKT